MGGLPFQREVLTLALATLAAFALAGASRPGSMGRALVVAVLVVAGVEPLLQGEPLNPFGSAWPARELELWRPRCCDSSGAQPGTFRVVGEGTALFLYFNVFAGSRTSGRTTPWSRARCGKSLNCTVGYRPTDYFKRSKTSTRRSSTSCNR